MAVDPEEERGKRAGIDNTQAVSFSRLYARGDD